MSVTAGRVRVGRNGGSGMARGGAVVMVMALAALVTSPLQAQQEREWDEDLEDVVEDIGAVWTSPLRADAGDALVLVGYGAAFGALYVVDGPVQDWVRAHHDAFYLSWLDAVGEASPLNLVGRTHVITSAGILTWLIGLAADEPDLRDAGLGCVTANLATTLSRGTITRIINRARPMSGEGPKTWDVPGGGDWPMRSFPGGHAANGMSCASFLANRFDWGAAEVPIYALAASMGVARIRDEAHWTSDTFIGLAYGWNVGRMVARRFVDREEERALANALPGITVGARFRF